MKDLMSLKLFHLLDWDDSYIGSIKYFHTSSYLQLYEHTICLKIIMHYDNLQRERKYFLVIKIKIKINQSSRW